jgi:hypothetical protein
VIISESDTFAIEGIIEHPPKPPRPERRYKTLGLSAHVFWALLCGQVRIEDLGVPADAELVRWQCDFYQDSVGVIVSHPSFDPVEDGLCPPTVMPTFRYVMPALT